MPNRWIPLHSAQAAPAADTTCRPSMRLRTSATSGVGDAPFDRVNELLRLPSSITLQMLTTITVGLQAGYDPPSSTDEDTRIDAGSLMTT